MDRETRDLIQAQESLRIARNNELQASMKFEDGLIDYNEYRAACNEVDRLQALISNM